MALNEKRSTNNDGLLAKAWIWLLQHGSISVSLSFYSFCLSTPKNLMVCFAFPVYIRSGIFRDRWIRLVRLMRQTGNKERCYPWGWRLWKRNRRTSSRPENRGVNFSTEKSKKREQAFQTPSQARDRLCRGIVSVPLKHRNAHLSAASVIYDLGCNCFYRHRREKSAFSHTEPTSEAIVYCKRSKWFGSKWRTIVLQPAEIEVLSVDMKPLVQWYREGLVKRIR